MNIKDPLALFSELGFAVFSRTAARVFKPIGASPAWWTMIGPALGPGDVFVPTSRQPFLQSFLDEADEFWCEDNDRRRLGSAIWELSRDEEQLYVQMIALKIDSDNLLIFHNVDATGEGWRAQLQAGRDSQLELIRDIARRNQLELELRNAHQASEKLHQARTEFLANVSHELRTPLTSILGMADLLSQTKLSETQSEYGAIIERSAQSLLRLVNDVLDMSRYEAGTVEIESKEVNLAQLIKELEGDFSPAAKQKGIEFFVKTSGATPKTIWQDPLRLRQVINNLVDNAIRFTESGHVSVTFEPSDSQTETLRITVEDTGIGIGKDNQQVVFDSFTQVDASHAREYSGTGLGLAIANKLLNCIGGSLQLESELGQGSAFIVSIPYQSLVGGQPAQVESIASEVVVEDGDLDSIVVLIAEDNAVNRRYIRHVVEKANGKALEAGDGRQALEALCEREVQVVVMDCQMPVLDGLEVTSIVRNAERTVGGHLPIIAVTAHAMRQDVDHCLAVGMDSYLSKPFKPADLRIAIRKAARSYAEPVAGSLRDELTKQNQ